MPDYTLDASRCALIVQDLQNDVIIDGGAFAETGSPDHAQGAERRRERARTSPRSAVARGSR